MPRTAPSLTPGLVNANGQMLMARTGAASRQRAGQVVYRLRCTHCGLGYGCAGIDVAARLCPGCQGGVTGEPLAEPGLSLFV